MRLFLSNQAYGRRILVAIAVLVSACLYTLAAWWFRPLGDEQLVHHDARLTVDPADHPVGSDAAHRTAIGPSTE